MRLIESVKRLFDNSEKVSQDTKDVAKVNVKGVFDDPSFGPSFGVPFSVGAQGDTLNVYAGMSSWVSACVDAITRDCVTQDYFFTSKASGDELEMSAVDKKIKAPYENAWHYVNFKDIMEMIVPSLKLTGNAFIWKVRGSAFGEVYSIPDTFIPIPSNKAKVQLRVDGQGVDYYQFTIEGLVFQVAPEDVIHFRQNTLFNPFIGVGDVTKQRLLIEGDVAATEYINQFLVDSKGAPAMIFLDKTHMQENDMQRTSDMLKKVYSKKILYANVDDADIIQNSLLTRDFSFLEKRKADSDAICAVFGVPKLVLGISEGSNRATSNNQIPFYYRSVINPLLEKLGRTFCTFHTFTINPDVELKFRKHATGEVEETVKKLLNGIITPNTAAELLGHAFDLTDEKRNQFYIPAGVQTQDQLDLSIEASRVAVDNLNNTDTQSQDKPKPDQEPVKHKRLDDPRNVDAILEVQRKLLDSKKHFQLKYLNAGLKSRNTLEDKYVLTVSEYFKRQEEAVSASLKQFTKGPEDPLTEEQAEQIGVQIEVTLKTFGETEKELLKNMHTAGVIRGVSDINALTGSAIQVTLSNPFVKSAIDMLGNQITGVLTETTLKKFRAIMKKSMEQQWNINRLQDEIQGTFAQFQTTRARMIARTEARAAWDAGATVAYQDIGVKKVDVIGCTMFESYSACGWKNIDVHLIPTLKFHPNHIGVITPAEEVF